MLQFIFIFWWNTLEKVQTLHEFSALRFEIHVRASIQRGIISKTNVDYHNNSESNLKLALIWFH